METISLDRTPAWVARYAGPTAALFGVLNLLQWAAHTEFSTFNPHGFGWLLHIGLGLILAGFSLRTLQSDTPSSAMHRLGQAASVWVGLTGAILLLDATLVRTAPSARAGWIGLITVPQQRPSPLTALNFLSLGLSLYLLPVPALRVRWTVDALVVAPLLISLLAIVGHVCHVSGFYSWPSLVPGSFMSLSTALAFLILGLGILCARPERQLMQIILSGTAGGTVARRLLLAPVAIPLITGLAAIAFVKIGVYDRDLLGWAFSYFNLLVFTAAIWWVASLLTREGHVRQSAEAAIRELNQKLEQRIAERTSELEATLDHIRWLASFPERNPNPIVEIGLDGVVHYQNPFASRLFPDLKEYGFRHPWLAGLADEAFALLGGKSEAFRREIQIGQTCYSQSVSYVDEKQRFRVYGTDITERRQAEEAVVQERNLLRTLIDHLPACIDVKDLEGRCLLSNAAFLKLAGASSESALLGRTAMDYLPIELAEKWEADDRHVMQSGQPIINREEQVLHWTGELRWCLVTKLPLHDGYQTVALLGISQDITDRKENEEKIRKQLDRFDLLSRTTRAIAERQDLPSIFQVVVKSLEYNVPVDFSFVGLCDPLRQVMTITAATGRGESEAAALAMREGAFLNIEQNGLARCMEGQVVYEADIASLPWPFVQRLAEKGVRSITLCPLLLENEVFGLLAAARCERDGFSSADCEFIRQLSEHVALAVRQTNLQSALRQAYEDLRKTQEAVMQQERLRALGQMASGIAHDINNAISPVALYTESLLEREPGLSPQAREYLETIQRAVQDVASTVGRMREFYRQREAELPLTAVDLNELVPQVIDLTRPRWSDMAQHRGTVIQLTSTLQENLPAILGVESEIREALTNLVLNAVDAMPNGGTITLRTLFQPGVPLDSVALEVIDSGIGMDEATRRRCLEPFFTTKGERGTGLGLAMVFGMVQRHRAEIEIESAVGVGTTVRLRFSLRTHSKTEMAPLPEKCVPEPLRLLVVDDDPALINTLRDTLKAEGHHVTTASGGQAGIDAFLSSLAEKTPFSLVLTDLGMPYVDGRKVAEAVKAASPSTPVVLLTGWGQRMVEEGELPAGVDVVLSKPPKLADLRKALSLGIAPPPTPVAAGEG